MHSMIWVIVAIAVIVVLAVVVLAALRGRKRLRPLPDESRMRYAESWRQVESRFVDSPQEAVREADALVLSIYRERGGSERDLPSGLRDARERVHGQNGGDASMTENLRQAMQEYRSTVGDLLGTDPREAAQGRREVAS